MSTRRAAGAQRGKGTKAVLAGNREGAPAKLDIQTSREREEEEHASGKNAATLWTPSRDAHCPPAMPPLRCSRRPRRPECRVHDPREARGLRLARREHRGPGLKPERQQAA